MSAQARVRFQFGRCVTVLVQAETTRKALTVQSRRVRAIRLDAVQPPYDGDLSRNILTPHFGHGNRAGMALHENLGAATSRRKYRVSIRSMRSARYTHKLRAYQCARTVGAFLSSEVVVVVRIIKKLQATMGGERVDSSYARCPANTERTARAECAQAAKE